jgi:hypothetical protein
MSSPTIEMQEGGRIFEGGGAGGSASRPARCRAALRRWPGGVGTGARLGYARGDACCSRGLLYRLPRPANRGAAAVGVLAGDELAGSVWQRRRGLA